MSFKHGLVSTLSAALLAGSIGITPVFAEMTAAEQDGVHDLVVTWRADDPAMLEEVTLESIPAGGKSLEFVSMPACRIFDTRLSGGPFGGGVYREYSILNADVPSQGGNGSGCNFPSDAVSVVMSLSAVNGSPTSVGYLRTGPAGEDPSATVLAFSAGQGISVTTNTELDLSSEMRVRIFGGVTNIVGDAVGYYRRTLHATVNDTGTLIRGSGVVQVEQGGATGGFVVTFDRDISECTPVANADYNDDVRVMSVLNGPVGEVYVKAEAYDSKTGQYADFNLIMGC